MCGIAGFINYSNLETLLAKTNQVQAHRGPDSQGSWLYESVAFAHQRLSIIDLSERSNQPFEKEGLVILFNGEIYNYQELRNKLIKERGVVFVTSGDTEVVLEAFRHWGLESLNNLKGMFAFAIFDKNSGKLILVRDHFGIKPLFYSFDKGRLAFASELKTLLRTGVVSPEINKEALLASLNYLWIPDNTSFVAGANKLPPAHYLEFSIRDNTPPTVRRYWELTFSPQERSEAETIEELDRVLQDSVQRHMVADVSVSSFLSGGLDSSLLSVLAAKHNPSLSTYTIGTRTQDKRIEQMPDDERYADMLVRQHGFDHHKIIINPSVVDELPYYVALFDEPIGDPAAINTYLICKQAREAGVKVLLSGMGADEIFFGYRRHQATLLAAKYQKLPTVIRNPVNWLANQLPVKFNGRGFKPGRWAQRFVSFANLPLEKAYRRSYSYYNDEEYGQLLTGDFSKELAHLNDTHNELFYQHQQLDLENKMCFTDMQMFMAGLNLAYSDKASMAASVEVRVPFIDKDVIEFAMSIPGKYKFKQGKQKYILKKVAEKYLPDEIIYRPKASFGAPIRSWISNDLREVIDDLLSEGNIKNRGIFNPSFVRKLITDDRKGIADNAYQIYQLLTLELWLASYKA
jgi:asparagine synthase (glutamine-hydrolysing)